jgi:ribonuclease Z
VEITFVGTSSGKISQNRFHSSLLFILKNYKLLVDAGDGISRALISNHISFNSINGILITHLHADHFSGLPALITQMKITMRNEPLEIFIHKSLIDLVKEFLLNSYLLPERIGFDIRYRTFDDDEKVSVDENFFFKARKNSHLINLDEYISNYPELNIYSASFLFEKYSKKLIYTSDVGSEDDILLFEDVRPDLLISEITHISLQSLLKKISILNPSKTYLTHYPDEDIPLINEILSNLPVAIKRKVILAEDNLSFNF